jgi:hypothetical protein
LKDLIKTGPWLRSIEAWDKLCLGEATTPFYIIVHIYLKDRPQMQFGTDGIPFAHLRMGVAHFIEREGTGAVVCHN